MEYWNEVQLLPDIFQSYSMQPAQATSNNQKLVLFYVFLLCICHLSVLVVLVELREVLQMALLCRLLNILLHILVTLCKSLLILLIF